ncbi:hypothetical protein GCM10027168_69240 [Streptomyces capparidis]
MVERSLAWTMPARRHARDYERLVQHSETLITWAAITLMPRRLTRGTKSVTQLPVTPRALQRASEPPAAPRTASQDEQVGAIRRLRDRVSELEQQARHRRRTPPAPASPPFR